MNQQQIQALVDLIVAEVKRQGLSPSSAPTTAGVGGSRQRAAGAGADLDLADLTTAEYRQKPYIQKPANPEALRVLMATTPARIGIGRAGARYRIIPQLIFWADHAVTQDALFKEIDPALLAQFNL